MVILLGILYLKQSSDFIIDIDFFPGIGVKHGLQSSGQVIGVACYLIIVSRKYLMN